MVDANGAIAPAIFGCAGLTLSADEQAFFQEANPLGFILFARNCGEPNQVKILIETLRASVGRTDAPVLIDQEGGRVARLTPPHWRAAPAPARFAEIAEQSPERAIQAAKLNAHLMAAELITLGITVNCTPVIDLPQPGADPIIGDRALGHEPEIVTLLGRAVCEGMMDGGVIPVIKHIPGHGRAPADSHKSLPVVETGIDELKATDFMPFRALRDMPWAMTAHVLYPSIDSTAPATTSKIIIGDIIRGVIDYQGVLVSDDLSMEALSGDMKTRTTASLDAGCDLVLHCNGKRTEMESIMKVCGVLRSATVQRLRQAEQSRKTPVMIDPAEAEARLNQLMDS